MNTQLPQSNSPQPQPHLWLVQSAFSFLQGASLPQDLLRVAQTEGYRGICLTDFDGVYGLPRFHLFARSSQFKEEAQRHAATHPAATPGAHTAHSTPPPAQQDMRLFYGTQVRINLHHPEDLKAPPGCDPHSLEAPAFLQSRLALIAENPQGYQALCRLLRYTHRNGKAAAPLDLNDPAVPWPSHSVTAVLPMRGPSLLCPPHRPHAYQKWLDSVHQLHQIWNQQSNQQSPFFLALTPPSQPLEQQAFSAHLKAHTELSLPLLATEDVFFASDHAKPCHDLLQAVRLNRPLAEVSPWACFPNTERKIQPWNRLVSFCARHPIFQKALAANVQLADRMHFSLDQLHYRYPREFVPEGMSTPDFLEQLTWKMAQTLYEGKIPSRVQALLTKELALVRELDFADYFLTVWDIVTFARAQNILCQGRGSAANSCVCYVLGITAVDPMQHDILFERFISRERGEPPDIDVDFEHERREEVIQYIYERYGRSRAAMVANVICFRKQGALRAAGKALGLPLSRIDRVIKSTQDRFLRGQELKDILKQKISADQWELDETTIDLWLNHARLLQGLPRHLGIHSGGFVISQNSLDELCPTEPATMANRTVIQWCKDDLEGLGLFKIDVLALGMLTALRKTLDALRQHGVRAPHPLPGSHSLPNLSLATIPANCLHTYDMICRGQTMGTFQIESRAQMSIIPRLQPRCFYDLVIQIGIIRPGPIVAGTVTRYVKRRTGEEAVTFPDPRLRPILGRTLGVPVFQEQVMRIAMAVGNFTPGEADELRRCMGAWKMTGTIYRFEEKLRAGMQLNGIPDDFADQIYRQIEGFAEYGFPESHTISFAHLAYASAWLKAHYPAYFLLGLLNAQPLGFYSVHSLIQEARREGVQVSPPCLVFSDWDHRIYPNGELRLGMRLVTGLPEAAARSFCAARTGWYQQVARFARNRSKAPVQAQAAPPIDTTLHTHRSLPSDPNKANTEQDMHQRPHLALLSATDLQAALESFFELMDAHLDSKSCMTLITGGLLNAFSRDRRMLLWHKLGAPGTLHSDLDLRSFNQTDVDWLEEFEDLRDDTTVTGTSLRGHPMSAIKQHMWPYLDCDPNTLVCAQSLLDRRQELIGRRIRVCGLVNIKQAPPTAKGMVFVTLEDETGFMNLTFTPQKASTYREILSGSGNGLLCVEGLLQGPGFGHSVLVAHAFPPRLPKASPPTQPHAKIHSNRTTNAAQSQATEPMRHWGHTPF